jgi:hypothetical protein
VNWHHFVLLRLSRGGARLTPFNADFCAPLQRDSLEQGEHSQIHVLSKSRRLWPCPARPGTWGSVEDYGVGQMVSSRTDTFHLASNERRTGLLDCARLHQIMQMNDSNNETLCIENGQSHYSMTLHLAYSTGRQLVDTSRLRCLGHHL